MWRWHGLYKLTRGSLYDDVAVHTMAWKPVQMKCGSLYDDMAGSMDNIWRSVR